jgi:trans-aconitate methyltransferase
MRTTMKPKKWTPDEYRAWRAARDATQRELQSHIERIKAELAARRGQERG